MSFLTALGYASAVYTIAPCMSVSMKSMFYRNGKPDGDDFWHGKKRVSACKNNGICLHGTLSQSTNSEKNFVTAHRPLQMFAHRFFNMSNCIVRSWSGIFGRTRRRAIIDIPVPPHACLPVSLNKHLVRISSYNNARSQI